MSREVFLGLGIKAVLQEKEADKRVILSNPEALKFTSPSRIWSRMVNTLCKAEFEDWVATMLMAKSMEAIGAGRKAVDITEINSSKLCVKNFDEDKWETWYDGNILLDLPIFHVALETEYKIFLDFILQNY